jgi:hypothetical protein
MRRTSVVLVLACFAFVACAKPPPGKRVAFSEAVRERHQLTDAQVRQLQYYISHQIVLERRAAGGTRHVERGRLIVRGDRTIQQVVIEAGTPGWIEPPAFVGVEEGRHIVEVSFDRGAPLRFAARDPGGAYVLAAPLRKQTGAFYDFFPKWGLPRRFEVPFAGNPWRVAAGADSYLMFQQDALEKLRSTHRVLPGVVGPGTR